MSELNISHFIYGTRAPIDGWDHGGFGLRSMTSDLDENYIHHEVFNGYFLPIEEFSGKGLSEIIDTIVTTKSFDDKVYISNLKTGCFDETLQTAPMNHCFIVPKIILRKKILLLTDVYDYIEDVLENDMIDPPNELEPIKTEKLDINKYMKKIRNISKYISKYTLSEIINNLIYKNNLINIIMENSTIEDRNRTALLLNNILYCIIDSNMSISIATDYRFKNSRKLSYNIFLTKNDIGGINSINAHEEFKIKKKSLNLLGNEKLKFFNYLFK